MRRTVIFAAMCAAMLAAGCASTPSQPEGQPAKAKVKVVDPEVELTQISALPEAARFVTGGIPVKYQIRVTNHDKQTLTLTRITVQSVGAGAYSLRQSSQAMKLVVAPDGLGAAEFWVSAFISDPTVAGANGPVTLRATADFSTPEGSFEHIWVQQVHENMLTNQG